MKRAVAGSRVRVVSAAVLALLLTLSATWALTGGDDAGSRAEAQEAAADPDAGGAATDDAWLEPDPERELENLSPGERRASKAAQENAGDFVRRSTPGKPSGWRQLRSETVGAARGEIEAMRQSYADEGLTLVGRPRVVSTELRSIDDESEPRTVVLDVCIDASDVDVLDSNGESVGDRLYRPDAPVLHVYELRQADGEWLISRHAIPADSTCEKKTEES